MNDDLDVPHGGSGWPVVLRDGCLAVGLVLLSALTALAWSAPPVAGCDEAPLVNGWSAATPAAATSAPVDAAQQLAALARDALAQSQDVRSAQHGSRAARFDRDQTAAAARPAVGLSGGWGVGRSAYEGDARSESRTSSLGLNLSAPLYDGGRLDELLRYRQRMVEAGELGVGSVRERVVRDAVVTALERSRYVVQLAVHDRHVGKMACLVRLMEQVVELDRGRSSELLQARKGLQQARLAREDAVTAQRQTEQRLQQLVGGGAALLPWDQLGAPLQALPTLPAVLDEIAASPDIRQLRLQADAMDAYARASRADLAPQLRWQAGTTQSRQSHLSASAWNVGVTLNLVLADGGAAAAGGDAAAERALAARRQEDALVEERTRTATLLHDTARSAVLRATQILDVLRDSEQVRAATYEQWARLGRRSLFDLMAAEADHVQLRLAEVNARHDAWSAVAQLRSVGAGLVPWLVPEMAPVAVPGVR